jgi:hypothetical protein
MAQYSIILHHTRIYQITCQRFASIAVVYWHLYIVRDYVHCVATIFKNLSSQLPVWSKAGI